MVLRDVAADNGAEVGLPGLTHVRLINLLLSLARQ